MVLGVERVVRRLVQRLSLEIVSADKPEQVRDGGGSRSPSLAGDDCLEWRGVCALCRVSRFTYPKLLR